MIPVQCATCRHYQRQLRCDAFSLVQIPREILMSEHDHRDPYPGDNGIRYDPSTTPATDGAARDRASVNDS